MKSHFNRSSLAVCFAKGIGSAIAGCLFFSLAQAQPAAITDSTYFGAITSAADGPGVVGIRNLDTGTNLSYSRPGLGQGSERLFDVVFTQEGTSYAGICGGSPGPSCNPFIPFFDSETSARTASAAIGSFFNAASGPISVVDVGWASVPESGVASIYVAFGPVVLSGFSGRDTLVSAVVLDWSPNSTSWNVASDPLVVPWRAIGDQSTNHCTLGFGLCTLPPATSWAFFAPAGAWAEEIGVVGAIPEPSTYALLLTGLFLLSFAARRKKLAEQT